MKTLNILLSLLLLVSLVACTSTSTSGSQDASSFVQFGSHQWEKGSFDCNKFKEKCAKVSLDYPEAIFGDEKVRSSINEKIKSYVSAELQKALGEGEIGASVVELADRLLADYDPKDGSALAEVSVFGRLMFRNQHFIKVELSSFNQDNEGRISSNRSLCTFDTKEGKLLAQTVLNEGKPRMASVNMK